MSFEDASGHIVAVRPRDPRSRRGALIKVPTHKLKTLHKSVRLDTLLSTLLASHGATAKDAADTFARFEAPIYHAGASLPFGDHSYTEVLTELRGRFC
jgi:hypothetical protein